MNSAIAHHSTANGLKITNEEFLKVRKMIFSYCGISINDGKEALVQSRLMKRIRKLELNTFSEYLKYVDKDRTGKEFLSLVDVLTTNKTNFFREDQHFDFIKKVIFPKVKGQNLKWWSAGCSSGEEPITLSITLLENQQTAQWNSVKILATDISRDVLLTAKSGVYKQHKIVDVPSSLISKYFDRVGDDSFKVKNQIRSIITYGRLNLTDNWPLKGDFQMIMCRNVMIYFNRQTQEEIVRKFREQLAPGGYLFIGHSESIAASSLGFRNVAPAVYQKI